MFSRIICFRYTRFRILHVGVQTKSHDLTNALSLSNLNVRPG